MSVSLGTLSYWMNGSQHSLSGASSSEKEADSDYLVGQREERSKSKGRGRLEGRNEAFEQCQWFVSMPLATFLRVDPHSPHWGVNVSADLLAVCRLPPAMGHCLHFPCLAWPLKIALPLRLIQKTHTHRATSLFIAAAWHSMSMSCFFSPCFFFLFPPHLSVTQRFPLSPRKHMY